VGRIRQTDYAEYVELVWGFRNESGVIKWDKPELCRLDAAVRSVLAQPHSQPDTHQFMIVRAKGLKAITTYKAALAIYKRLEFPKA
jgi:hypothetical protein